MVEMTGRSGTNIFEKGVKEFEPCNGAWHKRAGPSARPFYFSGPLFPLLTTPDSTSPWAKMEAQAGAEKALAKDCFCRTTRVHRKIVSAM